MSWTNFFAAILIVYFLYYLGNIIWDLFINQPQVNKEEDYTSIEIEEDIINEKPEKIKVADYNLPKDNQLQKTANKEWVDIENKVESLINEEEKEILYSIGMLKKVQGIEIKDEEGKFEGNIFVNEAGNSVVEKESLVLIPREEDHVTKGSSKRIASLTLKAQEAISEDVNNYNFKK